MLTNGAFNIVYSTLDTVSRFLTFPYEFLQYFWYKTRSFLSSNNMSTTEESDSNPNQTFMQWDYQPILPKNIQEVKDKCLKMKLAKKRSYYKCEDNYVTLLNVPKWWEYFIEENLATSIAPNVFDVNEELNCKVSLWSGDITALEIDSIVNAANSSLLGGSGVDGAIHSAAGVGLLDECRILQGCPEGKSKITGGYLLPAKYVIHTVGPQGEKPEILRSSYLTSLELMLKNELRSTAFPCISTGVYGYPPEAAAKVALQTVREFLEKNSDQVDRIIFVVFLDEDKAIYEELMQLYFPLE